MYPELFRIGGLSFTSFGVLVAIGTLTGLFVFKRELAVRGLPPEATEGAMAGMFGGFAGAKLVWVAEHIGQGSTAAMVFSRGGMSWLGGLIFGVAAALLYFRVRGVRSMPVMACIVPALAIGHALGRLGCFLVGDDYGRPTGLPWGIAFPRGSPPTIVPVHPAQLYEAAWLAVLFILLIRWRRSGRPDRMLVGRYLLLAGTARFAIEFIRVGDRIVFGLTVAQLGSMGLISAGAWLLLSASGGGCAEGDRPAVALQVA